MFGPQLSGCFHFEAMYTTSSDSSDMCSDSNDVKGLAVPIELNARIGGAETYTNIRSVWGVDLARQALRLSLGLPPKLPGHLMSQYVTAHRGIGASATAGCGDDSLINPRPSPAHHIIPCRPLHFNHSINFVPDWRGVGVLKSVSVDERLRSDPRLVGLELYYSPGAVVKLPPAGYSNLGWMVVSGDSSEEAMGAMEELQAKVVIKLKAPPPSS